MPTRTKPQALQPAPLWGSPLDPPEREYHVGLDLGKRQDYTALAVVEKTIFPSSAREEPATLLENIGHLTSEARRVIARRPQDALLRVVYLSRLELKVDYRLQMQAVARQYHNIPRGDVRVEKVAVDVTGVGDGITPLLDDVGVPHCDVWITSGSGETYDSTTRTHHVGRSYLINHARRPMEQRRLKASKALGPVFGVFLREIRGMEFDVTPAQNIRYIHREGEHDDLVLATSLACWSASKRPPLRVVAKPAGM